MKRLILLLTICFSIHSIAIAGGSCNKDKKCCKTASSNGKSCCKSKKTDTETSSTETAAPATTDANAVGAAEGTTAPAKSCCKGKKTACTKAQ
jgi:hypothetical protein